MFCQSPNYIKLVKLSFMQPIDEVFKPSGKRNITRLKEEIVIKSGKQVLYVFSDD
jgi:hypothetical protein